MQKSNLLAIDCGTQSIRALVFDATGELLAKAQVSLDGYFSDQSGWVEQHVNYFWDSLCRVCNKLWTESDIVPESILGVSVTTQRATMINLDSKGAPLRPAIIWMDKRQASLKPNIHWLWRTAFQLVGVQDTVEQFALDAEINWIKQHQPDIYHKTHKYLFLSGYYNYKLCGEYVDSVGSQVGYVPFDYKSHQWAGKRDWKWQACPVKPEQLPDLIAPGETMGHITAEASGQTGLLEGTPLIAAAADKACEVLGCGCLTPDHGQISYGTTATINTSTSRYVEPIRFIPPYPAAIPETYNTEFQIYRGYWMVSWFKEQFAHQERMTAEQQGVSTETVLDQQAGMIEPGANGLILQPYWNPGVRHPGPEARGAIIGFTDQHTRAHIYRAMIEGIAFGLLEGRENIERRSGTDITRLSVSGGGSQSKTALQVTADIFNLPVQHPATFETSGLGAAINIAVGLGVHSNYHDACKAMCHTRNIIEPIAQNVELYQQIYQQAYRPLYKKLSPLYKRIRLLN
ncbi:FGGY-family carbohydrate kinase [Pleionea sp. CnH1-48]|uniref:FGGY-family carbohydrate kinase n=1 Tax=Pleionea sp. CnH1-48 TaxID=2954494 RepID=UPI002096AC79|nr:FGGY-family carbohydrate kinase [Pleionea sp. CnH1-48]MCO7226351.1 FGGY-family carbohydrate kinase [Pleionea sp. CnH1-48]